MVRPRSIGVARLPPRTFSVDDSGGCAEEQQGSVSLPRVSSTGNMDATSTPQPPSTRSKLKWQLSRQESLSWSSLFLESSSSKKNSPSERRASPPIRMNIDMESMLRRIKQKGRNRHTFSHVEDKLCDMFRTTDDSGRVNVTKFLEALATVGLRQTDPRLTEMKRSILGIQASCARDSRFWSYDGLCFDEDIFKGMIMDNIDIVNKALTGELVIPQFESFCGHIEEIYDTCKEDHSGKAACYIPQLDRVNRELWGVSLCTIDGQRYSVGDVDVPFTIQSVSKPIGYAIACADNGPDFVHKYVGQEPSGRSFNELCLDNNCKPHNPMINSGAIMISTLIKPELDIADRFDYIFKKYKKMTGGEYLGFNNAVFLSERQAADRNFALAYFMRENECFANKNIDLVSTLDFYFQMCSLEVTCESAAVIAGTLANGGVCPITGEAVLDPSAVRNSLCLMHSCGMYDYSGQFAFKCGVPAKSGVSGVIIVVIPNVMGFALYSPRLDSLGNSVRGVKFCKELVQKFNFHHFDNVSASTLKLDPRRTCAEKRADVLYRVLFAAAAGDLTAIRRYCLMDVSLNDGDYDGRTALHLAAAEGHIKVVDFLIDKCDVLVNPKDRWGSVPLDDAKMGGHLEIISYLRKKYKECGLSYDEGASNGLELESVEADSLRACRPSVERNDSPPQLLDALNEAETKLNNLALSETKPEPGAKPETKSEIKPEIRIETETGMKTETETWLETATQPETEAGLQMMMEPGLETTTQSQSQPEPGPVAPTRAAKLATVHTVSIGGHRGHRT